jgi:hypothetical protein
LNLLLVVVLALAAFYFLMSDMVSLAVLCIIGLVVLLYYYSTSGTREPAAYAAAYAGGAAGESEGPTVIRVGHGGKQHHKPSHLYKVRIYPTWENRSMWEEMGKWGAGVPLNTIGGSIYRLFSGKHAEKGWDMLPEEQMRGR